MIHLDIKVAGKVQGVFFRATTQQKARELGINGFARNENDGTVYIEAEGEKQNLEQFLQWLKDGPAHAQVDKIQARESGLKNFTEFSIQ